MSELIGVRSFNDEGMKAYARLILSKSSDICTKASELVNNPNLSSSVGFDFVPKNIIRRREMGEHLWKYFGIDSAGFNFIDDRRMWNWVAASFLPHLLEGTTDLSIINKAVGKDESRWIRSDSVLRHHRHLVSSPFFVYLENYSNVEDAMAALATPVLAPGEVVERITGKLSISQGSAMALATALYYDKKTGELKKGSSTHGSGGPKRLSYFLSQIDLTIDYQGMSPDYLKDLLPKEFHRFLDAVH